MTACDPEPCQGEDKQNDEDEDLIWAAADWPCLKLEEADAGMFSIKW
jgi:hypothetical protein